jgi:endonuclease/exonuclease/phosphatase family metal-dependent hydrolase
MGLLRRIEQIAFLTELSNFYSSNKEPILIGGDFNIIRFVIEKNTMDGVHRHTPLFNSLIHFYELKELVMCGGLYTWSNNQEIPILEKLDRVLVSQEWEDMFPQVVVNRLPREISDHNPLLVTINRSEHLPSIQF